MSHQQQEQNHIRIPNPLTGKPGHFSMWEFENSEGMVMIHPSVIRSLELLRESLCNIVERGVAIIITDATRTRAENGRLAKDLGWSDQGGAVSRNSRHLTTWGGIAVDIRAVVNATRKYQRNPLPQTILGSHAKKFFDFVKDDYGDGHVHCDNRNWEKRHEIIA